MIVSGCVKLAGGINSLSVATHAYTHAAAHKTEWVTGQRSLLYQSAGRQGLMALLKHEREGTEAQQTSAQTRTATTFAHGKHAHEAATSCFVLPVLQRSFFMLRRKWWSKWWCCRLLRIADFNYTKANSPLSHDIRLPSLYLGLRSNCEMCVWFYNRGPTDWRCYFKSLLIAHYWQYIRVQLRRIIRMKFVQNGWDISKNVKGIFKQ